MRRRVRTKSQLAKITDILQASERRKESWEREWVGEVEEFNNRECSRLFCTFFLKIFELTEL